jgi:transcriptional regulator with XRE-family HTH domain
MTTFKSALGRYGLSQREAAEYLDVSLDTIKSWCSGRRPVPPGIWGEILALHNQVQAAIDELLKRHEAVDFDHEYQPQDLRAMFPNSVLAELPDGPLKGAFATARLTAPTPDFIKK